LIVEIYILVLTKIKSLNQRLHSIKFSISKSEHWLIDLFQLQQQHQHISIIANMNWIIQKRLIILLPYVLFDLVYNSNNDIFILYLLI
jgi:hypothetical protein